MPRLPQQPLRAPTGLDTTSDAMELSPKRAPVLQNVICDQKGILRTQISYRNLLTADFPTPIDAVGYYYGGPFYPMGDPFNEEDLILFVSDGKLYYMTPNPDRPVPAPGSGTLAGGLTQPFDPGVNVHFVEFNGVMVCLQADGAKEPRKFDGTNVTALGMLPPGAPTVLQGPPFITSPPANKGTTEEYRYRLTYYDAQFRESSMGPATSILYTTGNCGTVDIPSFGTDTQVAGAYVYEQVPGDSNYYRVHDFPISAAFAWEDNLTDAEVQAMTTWPYPDNLEANSPPMKASVGAVHKNHLFLNNTEDPETLQVSNQGSPSQFSRFITSPLLGGPLLIETDQGDPVMALATFGSVLGVWKQRTFHVVLGDNITDFLPRAVHARGTLAPDTVARCDNTIFSHDLDGIYSLDYQSVFMANRMSSEIDSVFDALLMEADGQETIDKALASYIDNKYLYYLGDRIFVFDFRAEPAGWVQWQDIPTRP